MAGPRNPWKTSLNIRKDITLICGEKSSNSYKYRFLEDAGGNNLKSLASIFQVAIHFQPSHQALVFQRVDNAIHRINHYSADKCWQTNYTIHWIVIYPVDSVIHPLNNWGQQPKTLFNCFSARTWQLSIKMDHFFWFPTTQV